MPMTSTRGASALRARLFAFAIATLLGAVSAAPSHAGPGHDHGPPAPAASAPASPRVTADSESYQFVGIVEGAVLVIYLDRFADNSPVLEAQVEVTIGDTVAKAERQKNGTYEVASPLLRRPGTHEVLVQISEGTVNDLLVGSLRIPAPVADTHGFDHGIFAHVGEAARATLGSIRSLAWLLGGAVAVFGLALYVKRRRRALATVLILLSAVALGTTMALAGPGHDHGAAPSSPANGNAPQRLPDGTVFLPKPTQRLLEIRTRILEPQEQRQAVRFVGRVVADPNRSGVVQSTIAGRFLPPPGGLALIGTAVKAGDLMGRVAPSFISKDASDMAQTLGELEQQIALVRTKLARQETLLDKNVVAAAAVEEIRIQLDGLLKRRSELLAAKVAPQDLRAPVDGIVTAMRVVPGKVVSESDVLFEIIDPKNLMVEALVFDHQHAGSIEDAVSSTSDGAHFKLRFVGRNRALQQQYTVLKFEVIDPSPVLNIGTPVTVTGHIGKPVTGIVLPRKAMAQAPNGQTVVFRHKEPEIFEPLAVRFEPFGPGSVLITNGVARGDKIVVEGAPLVNQVR